MVIKDGAPTQNISGEKIHSVKIIATNNHSFELWINDSLSYLTIEEALELKDELQAALIASVKK